MIHEDKLPNKKYFNPAEVADSESLYKVVKIYTPNDCNSILKYIEIKSAEDTNNDAPNVLNNTIKEYSPEYGIWLLLFFEIFIDGQDINIKLPINKIKTSNNCDMTVTWNNPLYIPIPDPIDWIYNAFKDNEPA